MFQLLYMYNSYSNMFINHNKYNYYLLLDNIIIISMKINHLIYMYTNNFIFLLHY